MMNAEAKQIGVVATTAINDNKDDPLNEIKCDDTIKQALIKFDYKEPTAEQLARYIGFTDDEERMRKLFWQSVFNKKWTLLPPCVIVSEFGYSSANAYYRDNLRPRYIENTEYAEVDVSHPLVVEYNQWRLISSKKESTRGGHNAKYYIVTGKVFKKMLMGARTKRGEVIREYYIKVEELAMFMKDYISVLHQYIAAKHMAEQRAIAAKQLAEQKALTNEANAKAEKMRIINERTQQHINNTKVLDRTSTFYIATSKRYAAQNIFKPGHIDAIGKKALAHRLSTYNTGKTGDDLFYFCYVEEVFAARELDHKLKHLLTQMKYNRKKEMVVLHYSALKKIVDHVAANHTEDYSFFNNMITSGEYASTINMEPIIPDPIDIQLDEKPTKAEANTTNRSRHVEVEPAKPTTVTITEQVDGKETKTTKIDVTGATDEERRAILIQAIELFCKNDLGIEYNHTQHKDDSTKAITIEWKKLQAHVRSLCKIKTLNPWKTSLKSFIMDVKAVDRVRWMTARK